MAEEEIKSQNKEILKALESIGQNIESIAKRLADNFELLSTSSKKRKNTSSINPNQNKTSTGIKTDFNREKDETQNTEEQTNSEQDLSQNSVSNENVSEDLSDQISRKKRKTTTSGRNSRGAKFDSLEDCGMQIVKRAKAVPEVEMRNDFSLYSRRNLWEVVTKEGKHDFLFLNQDNKYQFLPTKNIAAVFGAPFIFTSDTSTNDQAFKEVSDNSEQTCKLRPILAKNFGNRYYNKKKKIFLAIYPDEYYIKKIKGIIDESLAAKSYKAIFVEK